MVPISRNLNQCSATDLVVTEVKFSQTTWSLIGLTLAALGVVELAKLTPAKVAVATDIKFPLMGKVPLTELALVVTLEADTKETDNVSPEVAAKSEYTVIPFEPMESTINNPLGSLNVMIPDETLAESVNLFAPSNKYTLFNEASAETPIRFNFKPVTFTWALSPFIKVNFINGTKAALETTAFEAGESEANITESPAPVGTGVGVGVGVGVTVTDPDNHSLNFARDNGPTWFAGAHPCATCHALTEAKVLGPKYEVSLPGEPAPDVAST